MKMSKMIFILILMKMLMMRMMMKVSFWTLFNSVNSGSRSNARQQQHATLKLRCLHHTVQSAQRVYRESVQNYIFQSHCRFFHFFHVFHPVMFRCEAQHFSLAQWLRNEMSTAKLSSCEVLGLREARHVGLLRLIAICCSLLQLGVCRHGAERVRKATLREIRLLEDIWKVRYPLWTKAHQFHYMADISIFSHRLSWTVIILVNPIDTAKDADPQAIREARSISNVRAKCSL
jgi:hypothetical protein